MSPTRQPMGKDWLPPPVTWGGKCTPPNHAKLSSALIRTVSNFASRVPTSSPRLRSSRLSAPASSHQPTEIASPRALSWITYPPPEPRLSAVGGLFHIKPYFCFYHRHSPSFPPQHCHSQPSPPSSPLRLRHSRPDRESRRLAVTRFPVKLEMTEARMGSYIPLVFFSSGKGLSFLVIPGSPIKLEMTMVGRRWKENRR
jgi:hypothetical protein